jgi:hypothetical protein
MTDHYGDCNEHICLVDLIGEEMMMEKCRHCGLDKEYPAEYKEMEEKLKNAK